MRAVRNLGRLVIAVGLGAGEGSALRHTQTRNMYIGSLVRLIFLQEMTFLFLFVFFLFFPGVGAPFRGA